MKVGLRWCSLILLLIFFSCTSTRQKQVWLEDLQRTHDADKNNLIRIYIDKRGYLYPDNDYYIAKSDFFVTDDRKKSGELEYYFTNDVLQRLNPILTKYNVVYSESDNPDIKFQKLQSAIRQGYINKINGLLSTNKTLVVLIHGFNDPDPTGDYQELRNYITRYHDSLKKFIYLEIYWDGLTANNGNPGTSAIWGRAQYNSGFVSLTVRRLLYSLDSTIDIKIITHSLGASVATGALFNTTSKWCKCHFHYDTVKTPRQKDIRLGMLAPAIPGTNTFRDFNQRGANKHILPKDNNIKKIVVGYNVNDYALTKRTGKFDHSGHFGATSLGCNRKKKGKYEIDATRDTIEHLGYTDVRNLFIPIAFTTGIVRGSKKKNNKQEHGLYYYMQNQGSLIPFLDALFNP